VPPLKQLHARYGDRVQFLDILVRQAHPGERRPAYATAEQKLADARVFQEAEGTAWPVLADDLAGTVHRAYGGMSDPVYLIDAAGRVAFYGMWIDGPTLRRAIDELLAQGGVGPPVAGGIDRRPHMAAALVEGWRSVSRGGVRAVLDLALAFPPLALAVALGAVTRPLTRPLVERTRPLPSPVRHALWGALAGGTGLLLWRARRN
jgi:hypothetical protein